MRVAGKVGVGFLRAGMRFSGELVDIGSSGLLVRCQETLPSGTMGQLGIEMGCDTIRTVVVARRMVPGVGIAFEFSHMNPRDRQALHRLLLQLSHPAPVPASSDPPPP